MESQLQIEFRHMEPSEALSQTIKQKTDKLNQIFDRITHCHITVEAPHRHHHKGQQFQVVVRVSVPGKTLTVHQRGDDPAHEDAYVAVRDAFNSMQRQLKAYVNKMKGHVKNHNNNVPLSDAM